MYQEDSYNITHQNDYDVDTDNMFEKSKKLDKGYNSVYRKVKRADGLWKNKKIELYTSRGPGTRIRDAETGEYYPNVVGSMDEDLFFKVALSTGECKSQNASNMLFYLSPEHYMNHLHCDVSSEIIALWEEKRKSRLLVLSSSKKKIN